MDLLFIGKTVLNNAEEVYVGLVHLETVVGVFLYKVEGELTHLDVFLESFGEGVLSHQSLHLLREFFEEFGPHHIFFIDKNLEIFSQLSVDSVFDSLQLAARNKTLRIIIVAFGDIEDRPFLLVFKRSSLHIRDQLSHLITQSINTADSRVLLVADQSEAKFVDDLDSFFEGEGVQGAVIADH